MFRTPLEAADRGRHLYLSSKELRKPGKEDEYRDSNDYCSCDDNGFPPVDRHAGCHLQSEIILRVLYVADLHTFHLS